MRAVVQRRYGRPERVLEVEEIDRPSIADDEVLLRVRAASVHADVWHVVLGIPYFARIIGAGVVRPKCRIPGTDAAGIVDAVGSAVTRWRPGDEVFGEIVRGHQWHNGGAFAEFASVPEDKLRRKPTRLTFEEAAAIPTSGLLGVQGVHHEGRLQPGDRVLINGAGGAVGTFAVQLAKAHGAQVTAVDRSSKHDMLRSIGADRLIDFTEEYFTQGPEQYDVIIDIPGNRSFDELQRVLGEGGRYVLIGHDDFGRAGNRWVGATIGRMIRLGISSPFGKPRVDLPTAPETREPLTLLADLADAGKLRPVIDRTYPLEAVSEALCHLETGDARGKIVITV